MMIVSGLAHMTVEGAGDFGNGALHPLATPSHALVLAGLGLLLGQREPFSLKGPMAVLAPLLGLALAATTRGWIGEVPPAVLSGLALAIGILVGVDWKGLPGWVGWILCGLAAVAIGLDSRVETGTAWVVAKTLAGTWFAVTAVTGYVAICASNGAGKPWARTAVRILGSWIVAISVMVLAFALRR